MVLKGPQQVFTSGFDRVYPQDGVTTMPSEFSALKVFPVDNSYTSQTGNEHNIRVADDWHDYTRGPRVNSDYRSGWNSQPPPPPNPIYLYGWNKILNERSLKGRGDKIAAAFRNEFGYLKSTTRDELLHGEPSRASINARKEMLNLLHGRDQYTYISDEQAENEYRRSNQSINPDMERLIDAVRRSGFANCNDQARIIRYRLQQMGILSAQIDLEFDDGRSNEGKSHTAVILGNWRHSEKLTPSDLRGTVVIDTWKGANKLDDVFDNPATSGDDWAVKMQDRYRKRYPAYWHSGIGISNRTER